MSTQCHLVDKRPSGLGEPGDMWFTEVEGETPDYYCHEGRLSDEYVATYLGKRRPLVVVIGFIHPQPGEKGQVGFGIDTATTSGDRHHGWTVTGEAPNITVSPSINIIGLWHGWLTNGVLSDG